MRELIILLALGCVGCKEPKLKLRTYNPEPLIELEERDPAFLLVHAAKRHDVDPARVLGIAEAESNLNPDIHAGDKGQSVGLGQIKFKYWKDVCHLQSPVQLEDVAVASNCIALITKHFESRLTKVGKKVTDESVYCSYRKGDTSTATKNGGCLNRLVWSGGKLTDLEKRTAKKCQNWRRRA